jgi:hypothetical protein
MLPENAPFGFWLSKVNTPPSRKYCLHVGAATARTHGLMCHFGGLIYHFLFCHDPIVLNGHAQGLLHHTFMVRPRTCYSFLQGCGSDRIQEYGSR